MGRSPAVNPTSPLGQQHGVSGQRFRIAGFSGMAIRIVVHKCPLQAATVRQEHPQNRKRTRQPHIQTASQGGGSGRYDGRPLFAVGLPPGKRPVT